MIGWRPRAAALAGQLLRSGVLTPAWRRSLEEVPRHVFVPAFQDGDGDWVSADDPAQQDRWLAAVYSDVSLTAHVRLAPGTELAWPTSSSTRPGLMARMLGLLEVGDGQRVLEVGTGTGYQAALLCHRLGDAAVTSVDIDAALVEAARERLAALGWRPDLVAGDGAAGVAGRAPYDRILATCAVPAIPPAWVDQLTEGGLLVADVRGELSSSLVVARKDTPHSVTGRFSGSPGHFMRLRAEAGNPLRDGGRFGSAVDFTDPRSATASMPLDAFDDEDFRFVLQLALPSLGPVGHTIRDGRDGVFLLAGDDASWVEIAKDSTVRYGGPSALWPEAVRAWRWWDGAGSPVRSRFGLTAHDGRQQVWLDHEDRPPLR